MIKSYWLMIDYDLKRHWFNNLSHLNFQMPYIPNPQVEVCVLANFSDVTLIMSMNELPAVIQL